MRYSPLLLLLLCCSNPSDPLYTSPVPTIEFRNLELRRGKTLDQPDTLKLSLVLKDGDNDLGLNAFPLDPPYNRANAFMKNTGAKVDMAALKTPESRNDVLRYRDRKIHPFDTLPKFATPYDCRNWNVTGEGGRVDTVYTQQNANYYNLEVIFLVESANGTFEPFDFNTFQYPNCANSFSGRFPWIDISKLPSTGYYSSGPYRFLHLSTNTAAFEYNLQSVGFHAPSWLLKKVKLRVNIVDRALHRSNIIETSTVQL